MNEISIFGSKCRIEIVIICLLSDLLQEDICYVDALDL